MSRRGTVEIRLSGDPEHIQTAATALAAWCTVLEQRGPYPNRRDPGVRVYLTVRTA